MIGRCTDGQLGKGAAADEDVYETQLGQQHQHRPHLQRRQHDQRRDQVGQHVTIQDLHRAQAHRLRTLDEQLRADGDHLAAHVLHHLAPAHKAEGNDKGGDPLPNAQRQDEDHGQQQRGEGSNDLREAHDQPVQGGTSVPASSSAQEKAHSHASQDDDHGHGQGAPCPDQHQAHDVPPDHVCAPGIYLGWGKRWHTQFAINDGQPLGDVGAVRRKLRAQEDDYQQPQQQQRT